MFGGVDLSVGLKQQTVSSTKLKNCPSSAPYILQLLFYIHFLAQMFGEISRQK
jgi:hypothetical protein